MLEVALLTDRTCYTSYTRIPLDSTEEARSTVEVVDSDDIVELEDSKAVVVVVDTDDDIVVVDSTFDDDVVVVEDDASSEEVEEEIHRRSPFVAFESFVEIHFEEEDVVSSAVDDTHSYHTEDSSHHTEDSFFIIESERFDVFLNERNLSLSPSKSQNQ